MRTIWRVVALLLLATAAAAQPPSADWRTVTTTHFRVHYPVELEAWSLRAASRLESIRDAVTREIGYSPQTVTDVLVTNPIAAPNGLAWPLLDSPRIVFYTEPPGPDEQIGAYTSWIDLLAVHEVAHVVHMLRPSRNPLQRLVERFILPLNPITRAAPRWVLEGYATVIEGRLTGAGRPTSAMRAAILRQWASSGRLPSYSQLNSDNRFLGMSMAYLAGSAYLEWLERRSGPDSLRRLWTRMTARQRRSFGEAFAGVFGDSPERLYGQFTAELTAAALAVNRSGELHEGELWQETTRNSGDPAVSPDGTTIAVVVRRRDRPANLVILSTGPPSNEEEEYEKRIARLLERDPEDSPPTRSKPLPRKAIHSYTPRDGGDIENPRWTPDGRSLLFSHRQPDADGVLHHDLFLWTPESGESRRITRLGDVFDADPTPDGASAVAVLSRNGFSRIVTVDLSTGSVSPLTEESLDVVQSHPRVSRDGNTVVYVTHSKGTWSLTRRDLRSGAARTIARGGGNFASPEWSRTRPDELYATLASGGHIEIHRVLETGESSPITRSSGVAMQPAPAPDGRVFFMGLDPDGFVLRVADGAKTVSSSPPYDPALIPALPPPGQPLRSFASQDLPAARPYGAGRQEFTILFGQNFAPSQNAIEVGFRMGDVVGRLDTIALASFGRRDAQRGVAVASAWRGWPVTVSAHLFKSEDRRVESDGAELRGSWTRHFPAGLVAVDGGALAADPLTFGFAEVRGQMRQVRGSWRAAGELEVAAQAGDAQHYRVAGGMAMRSGSFRMGMRFQADEVLDDGILEVGGLPSSILPRSAYSQRILDPALPPGTLRGDRYTGGRVEVALPSLPFTTFYQRHQMRSARLSLAGIELAVRSEPLPLLGLPALEMTAGAARIFDEPLKNDTKWWFGVRWLP